MPTSDSRLPFTEMFEVAQNELVREAASGVEGKYRGFVNQVYLNVLPEVLPDTYIRRIGFINTAAQYTTGTLTVGTGTSNIIGSSTSWTSANSNDFNIKVTGFNQIYRMTFVAGTSLTFQNSRVWTESSGTGKTYVLFQNRYSVASDYSFMVADDQDDPNVVSYMLNGNEIFVEPWNNDEYNRAYNNQTNTTFSGYTIEYNSSGTIYLKLYPNPSQLDTISYRYIPILTALIEQTTGTVTFAATTAVIGASTLFTSLNTANTYYIRNDADGTGSNSVWAKITSVANATALTLSAAFSGTTGTGQTYTISEISKYPGRFDNSILYKTALIIDPDNLQSSKWQTLYQEAISMDKSLEVRRNKTSQFKNFPGMKRYDNN